LYSYFFCTYTRTTSCIGVGVDFQSYLDSLWKASISICWYDHRVDDRQKGRSAHGVCTISDCKAINLDEICIGIVASIQQLAKRKA
jgi:hypothetical protein